MTSPAAAKLAAELAELLANLPDGPQRDQLVLWMVANPEATVGEWRACLERLDLVADPLN